ncbi:MAG TPA: hypothetical protein VGO57_09970, partial [Verrucomicrobiae bacterium]
NVANPLDGSNGNNAITNIMDIFSGNFDGDLIYVWNGASYDTFTIDSSWPSGVGNSIDSAAVTPPVVNPGTAIFIQNTVGATTNTFVGVVHVDGAGTGSIGVTTNHLAVGFSYVASKLPVAGGISSVLKLPSDGSLDGSIINVPNIVAGNVQGFTQYTIDSAWPSGFGNAIDSAAVPEPTIAVGSGFFIQNTSGATDWVQSY